MSPAINPRRVERALGGGSSEARRVLARVARVLRDHELEGENIPLEQLVTAQLDLLEKAMAWYDGTRTVTPVKIIERAIEMDGHLRERDALISEALELLGRPPELPADQWSDPEALQYRINVMREHFAKFPSALDLMERTEGAEEALPPLSPELAAAQARAEAYREVALAACRGGPIADGLLQREKLARAWANPAAVPSKELIGDALVGYEDEELEKLLADPKEALRRFVSVGQPDVFLAAVAEEIARRDHRRVRS